MSADFVSRFARPEPFSVGGVEVWLRPLSAAEWLEVMAFRDEAADAGRNLRGSLTLVALAVVTPDGARVFDGPDAAAALPFHAVAEIAAEVVDRLGKKKASSPATPSSSSPAGSPSPAG